MKFIQVQTQKFMEGPLMLFNVVVRRDSKEKFQHHYSQGKKKQKVECFLETIQDYLMIQQICIHSIEVTKLQIWQGLLHPQSKKKADYLVIKDFFFLHSVEKTYEIFVFLQNEINRNNYEFALTALKRIFPSIQ